MCHFSSLISSQGSPCLIGVVVSRCVKSRTWNVAMVTSGIDNWQLEAPGTKLIHVMKTFYWNFLTVKRCLALCTLRMVCHSKIWLHLHVRRKHIDISKWLSSWELEYAYMICITTRRRPSIFLMYWKRHGCLLYLRFKSQRMERARWNLESTVLTLTPKPSVQIQWIQAFHYFGDAKVIFWLLKDWVSRILLTLKRVLHG